MEETSVTPDAKQIASVARALAHPARVRIIALLLSRPGCIGGDIVDEIGLAQSTVSEHLRILKASGLVVGTIERPRICYSLDPAALAPLHALIGRIEARETPQGEPPACYIPQRGGSAQAAT
ncbi:MAG: winged helix-turn-helix transcriptional regulator [Pararhodobacter sp.]|nr:winged helix-turn-helix transcriptional regulator [Pararhodobacter sp.]